MELILDIKQLGPVKDSQVIWRPLTVFIGPNNTGKTYTAYLIHALLNTYPDHCGLGEEKISELFRKEKLTLNWEDLKARWLEAWKRKIEEWLFPNFWPKYFGIENESLKIGATLRIEENSQALEVEGEMLIWGMVPSEEDNDEDVEEEEEVIEEVVGSLYYTASLKRQPRTFEIVIEDQARALWEDYLEDYDLYVEYSDFEETFCVKFAHFLGFPEYNLIIPAERTAFLFYRQWFVLKDQIYKLFLENVTIKKWSKKFGELLKYFQFPEIFENFLTFLLSIEKKKSSEIYFPVVKFLEERLLKGRIVLKNDEFWFDFKENAVKISGASSGVKALLPLEKFLRTAPEGAFLVIDEPEMHLHPEAQVILAIALAMAVNLGLRVLITTHSPYILDTFNFLAWAYRIKEKIKEIRDDTLEEKFKKILNTSPFEVPEDALIDPACFSAYFFRVDGKVEDIRKISEDIPEVDIDWRTFSEVSEALWEKLSLLGEIQDAILEGEQ